MIYKTNEHVKTKGFFAHSLTLRYTIGEMYMQRGHSSRNNTKQHIEYGAWSAANSAHKAADLHFFTVSQRNPNVVALSSLYHHLFFNTYNRIECQNVHSATRFFVMMCRLTQYYNVNVQCKPMFQKRSCRLGCTTALCSAKLLYLANNVNTAQHHRSLYAAFDVVVLDFLLLEWEVKNLWKSKCWGLSFARS